MTDTPPAPSRRTIVQLKVDSYKRLRAASLSLTPQGLVRVRGRNGAGKSSALDAVLDLLGVERPERPITEGQHAGFVEAVLESADPNERLVVRERFTRDSGGQAKRALTIEAADGSRVSGPAAVLKALRGRFVDPVAFLDMKPDEQVKTVLHVLGLDEELARLEQVAQGHYDQRRDLGRDADRLEKAAAELGMEVDGLPPVTAQGTAQELGAQLKAAKDHNAALQGWADRRAEAERRGKALAARVQELEAELERARAEKAKVAEEWSIANAAARASAPMDTTPIEEALANVEAAARDQARRELAAKAKAEAQEARARHQAANQALEEARRAVGELLESVAFPIDGMRYDAETKELQLSTIPANVRQAGGDALNRYMLENGPCLVPFAQASQAERLKAAAAIAMAGAAEGIGVLVVREGSLLDAQSQAELAELVQARGFQLLFEVVESLPDACATCGLPALNHAVNGLGHDFVPPHPTGGGVWIEDGEAFDLEHGQQP